MKKIFSFMAVLILTLSTLMYAEIGDTMIGDSNYTSDMNATSVTLEVGTATVNGLLTAKDLTTSGTVSQSGVVNVATVNVSGYIKNTGTMSVTGATVLGTLGITGYSNVKTQLDNVATSTGSEVTARTNADLAIGLTTAAINTSRINGDLSLGLATATLQTNINATNVSTGALRNEIITSTDEIITAYKAADLALGVDTGTISTAGLAQVRIDTGTLANVDITLGLATGTNHSDIVSVGLTTATLRTDLSTLAASTAPVAQVAALQVATGTLRTDLDLVIVSTGTLYPKTGGAITGNVSMSNYTISVGTASISQALNMTPLLLDPVIISSGTFWIRYSEPSKIMISTGNTQDQIGSIAITNP